MATAPAETMFYVKVLASTVLVEASLDEGSIDAARRMFDEARNLVEGEALAMGGRNWLARAGTRLALAAGDVAEARHWSGLLRDEFWGESVLPAYISQKNRGAPCGLGHG